jgi:uncharacterized protein YdaU (DUF1376 family)
MARQSKKPLYQPWNEEEFSSDVRVSRGMNWLQRHLYRALLQSMFYCSTRPYLPDNDGDLWLLADAENLEMWRANKAPILALFEKVEIDGENLLRNKRVLEDWNKLVEIRERMGELGQRSAAVRQGLTAPATDVERTSSARLLTVNGGATSEVKLSEVKESKEKETNPGNTTGEYSSAPMAETKTLGDWKNIAVRHKRFFGNQASVGLKDKYAEACAQYSEEVVLECFDDWAADAKDWVKSNAIKQPLFTFFKKLPEMADVAVAVRQAEKETQAQQAAEQRAQAARNAATEAYVAKQKADDVAFMEKEPPPQNGGDALEYLADLENMVAAESTGPENSN